MKKSKFTFICFVAFAAVCFLFSSCGPKDNTIKLKFGHIASESNTWHKAAIKFKELVEERSKGRIKVQVYPNSTQGNEEEMVASIRLGTADMTITGESLDSLAPKAALLAVPYAFTSSAEMRAAASGPAGKEIRDEIIEKAGLVPIAWLERGPRHLTSNRPIKTPADLNGLRMRVPKVALFTKVWQELGAKPSPIDFSEVFTSLSSNIIEAQENPLSLIDSSSFSEVQKYVNLTAHVRSWVYIVIGEKKLNKMPKDLQDIVLQAAIDVQAYENELFLKEETELRATLEKKGMVFIDSDQEAFAKKASVAVKKNLTKEQGLLLERLKKK